MNLPILGWSMILLAFAFAADAMNKLPSLDIRAFLTANFLVRMGTMMLLVGLSVRLGSKLAGLTP